MKKELFTVAVDNYFPELCELTFPLLEKYAKRIGANFTIIKNRKYPDWPPTYEKMQIYELGMDNDYNILVDSDIIIKDKFPDITFLVPESFVGVYMTYQASMIYSNMEPFKDDPRDIGLATNFVVTTKSSHGLWKPLNCSWEEAKNYSKRQFIIDEYCASKNLAENHYELSGIVPPGFDKTQFVHMNVTTDNIEVKQEFLEYIKKFIHI